MDRILDILQALGIPFAYDHFAEGESPEPPFICYLLPASDNFAADGQVYFFAAEAPTEIYTDIKDVGLEASVEMPHQGRAPSNAPPTAALQQSAPSR